MDKIKKRAGFTITVLVLFLGLSLAPSVNADIIKSSFRVDLVDKQKSCDLEDNEELDWMKLPILYTFVQIVIYNRWKRFSRIRDIAVDIYLDHHGIPYIDIIHPLSFLWCLWLGLGLVYWIMFWKDFSYKLNLDWPINYPWVD